MRSIRHNGQYKPYPEYNYPEYNYPEYKYPDYPQYTPENKLPTMMGGFLPGFGDFRRQNKGQAGRDIYNKIKDQFAVKKSKWSSKI